MFKDNLPTEENVAARKTAIVTGASSGLGLELSLQLAAQDLLVVAVSRRASSNERIRETVRKGSVVEVLGDVADPEVVERAYGSATSAGNLELVLNAAGVGVFGPAGSYSKEDIDEVLRANVYGTILFSEKAYTLMKEQGGTLVNVMSTAAHVGRANEAIYCAAKWGARGYTEALRIEAKGSKLRIIAVYPGGMKTAFWSNAKGAKLDPTNFMDASEVAEIIIGAIQDKRSSYVSDIIIHRR